VLKISVQKGGHQMPVDKLHFAGSRDLPEQPEKVIRQRFEPAREEAPSEIVPAPETTLYVATKADIELRARTERLEKLKKGAVWRVEVSSEGVVLNGPPGRSQDRSTAEEICSQIDLPIDVDEFRPPWADVAYAPPAAPDRERLLRRLRRGYVEPAWIFGQDDRIKIYPSPWPWRCVGKIFNSRGKGGTGVLVGNRLVATAGHLVPWGDDPWWMTFVPAFYDTGSVYGANATSNVSDAKGYDASGDVCGYDWAILRLYNPLGSWLGYFGYNGYTDDWEDENRWCVIGYPSVIAEGNKPAYQFAVSVLDDDSDSNGGRELEVSADISGGNSGGPLFGWFKDGTSPRVIGVCSGAEYNFGEGDTNVFAGGSGFTNLITWGRQNWPL
jgi:V8-like Glu-specific endopeptidase